MPYMVYKDSEADENPIFSLRCDYQDCDAKFEGTEAEMIEEGWKAIELQVRSESVRIALCAPHSHNDAVMEKTREGVQKISTQSGKV